MPDALLSVAERLNRANLPVYLYGTGDGADKILDALLRDGIRPRGVFASDGFVRDRTFRGYRVERLADVEAREGRIAAVLCFGLEGDAARELLMPIASRHLLLAPSLPVYGDGCLDRALLAARRADVTRVYGWLADELSRAVFADVLRYTVSGEISYLLRHWDASAPPAGYFAHDRIHIDVGAYDGDTAREYLAGNPRCLQVLAFEPNPQTYRKLCAQTDPARVRCFPTACGAWDGRMYAGGSGRGSHVTGPSGTDVDRGVPVCRLDTVCGYPTLRAEGGSWKGDGLPIGSLKIDAEGEDANVLYGAANLITACRPAICVSAYHRAADLLDLPLLLKRLDYRGSLYVRKKPYVPAWDTAVYWIPKP